MFKIKATKAKEISAAWNTPFTTEEIVARIEKVISDAMERGRKSADYLVTPQDFLLHGNPDRFTKGLNDNGFYVFTYRDEDPHYGNNRITFLRICWE